MKKLLFISFLSVLITSCGEDSVKVEPMKKNDRELSCSDILLEINDAEFYKKQAEEKKSLGVKSIIMPLGYIDTYMNADEAITAADSRVEYLRKVYDIRGCQSVAGASPYRNQPAAAPITYNPPSQQNQPQQQPYNLDGYSVLTTNNEQ